LPGGPLTALESTALATTFGLSGVLAYVLLSAVGAPEVAVTIGCIGLAIDAMIVALRRWTPVLGSVFALLAFLLVVAPAPDDVARALAQPTDPLYAPLMVLFPLVFVGAICGVAAAVQNLRNTRQERGRPSWLFPLVAAAVSAAICGAALGAAPRPASMNAVSATALDSLPELRTSGFAFDQAELHVHAGETVALRLINADNTTHTFTIDQLGVDVPILPGDANVAVFRPTQPGTYIFYCKPHYDPATGRGMHGTLVVE
jgi:plastocyanin